jgi:hypothetical protein
LALGWSFRRDFAIRVSVLKEREFACDLAERRVAFFLLSPDVDTLSPPRPAMVSILANKSHQQINGIFAQASDSAGELAVFDT